jgi:unspecific monooxygenase
VEVPFDPVAAVVQPDPYPSYAGLVARRPFFHDARLGLWVATSASAVTAVLTHPACRVRPPAEPVPAAIADSAAGTLCGAMVRFNDGPRHGPLKATIAGALDGVDGEEVLRRSRDLARVLADELGPHESRAALSEFMIRLAPAVVASMLGAPAAQLSDVARWTARFVSATAPGASAEAVRDGAGAAAHLLEHGRAWAARDGLLATLVRHARGADQDRAVANGLGLLWQSHDATAALIGNTLVALGRMRGLSADHALLRIVAEVARYDAPVQNTRRFLADDAVIAGERMQRGDAVLVVLAAANRDPSANADPDRFDPQRAAPQVFTFGLGPHACPGAVIATSIATAGVETLLARGVAPERLAREVSYRPSANIRMPRF